MTVTLYEGDCLEVLKTLPAGSVQCCVTSPPYWGLRDYGVKDQLGLEPKHDCLGWATGEPCGKCFVCHMVQVFREVRRVLRDDGVLFLNLGDSYATNPGNGRGGENVDGGLPHRSGVDKTRAGLKPKDLAGIPWRVAFALQADGWYLRSDIIWHKPNPMPESVTDRPTKAHEYIFLLTKSARYFYDAEAVQEPAAYDGRHDEMMKGSSKYLAGAVPGQSEHTMAARGHVRWNKDENGLRVRNRRTVWAVATQPYSGAHFATFPPDLIEPCILAGSREGDTILDPFNGAGTTGTVAVKYHRRYIGIDINPKYLDLTRTRLEQTQPTLFQEGA